MLGTFITWNASTTEEMLGYVGNIISDFTPLLIPIIAIGVGLIIIGAIISAIKK